MRLILQTYTHSVVGLCGDTSEAKGTLLVALENTGKDREDQCTNLNSADTFFPPIIC